MYKSLTFYYSNSSQKEDSLERAIDLNVPWQLQMSNEWLEMEHFQHQQWATTVTRDYESSYGYEVQGFVNSTLLSSDSEAVDVAYTPMLLTSSKLFYSQLTICHSRSMFPGLLSPLSVCLKFQPFDCQKYMSTSAKLFMSEQQQLQQLLPKFVAWFKFSKLYLSFYLRKVSLEEDARLSETFSNPLICHWLATRCFAVPNQGVYAPFMEPTQVDIHTHLTDVKERISRMKAMSQFALICSLNVLIKHWVSAWGLYIRWSTLTYCEDRLKRFLQRWAKRRHPNKGWGWVCHKYWRSDPSAKKYVFWLRVLHHMYASPQMRADPSFTNSLVKLFQTNLFDFGSSESSSFTDWQFCCSDSGESLFPYSVMPLKKWRKSRSFEYFLLY
jgi:hypothetical protein